MELIVEDSKVLQKTTTCPECDCYCLHDVLHFPEDVRMFQCRYGACNHRWPYDDESAAIIEEQATEHAVFEEYDACRLKLIEVLEEVTKAEPRDLGGELEALLGASLAWASQHPLAKRVTHTDILVCDQRAMGHVDWSNKLPLYIAEMMYYPGHAARANHYAGRR